MNGPIPLSEAQLLAAHQWAADDRLWTTQETVEFNLCVFAREILKLYFEQQKAAMVQNPRRLEEE